MWRQWMLLAAYTLGSVIVLGPEKLIEDLGTVYDTDGKSQVTIHSTLANFGNPPYGAHLIGKCFYHDSNACDPLDHITVNKEDGIPILIADRGVCTFAMKARNAQDAGYKSLVVVDNIAETVEDVLMSDNGSGGNIAISVQMISKADGEKIKSFLYPIDKHVELKLTFDVEKRAHVSLRVLFSPENGQVLNFLAEFAEYANLFNHSSLTFHPHYALWYNSDAIVENYSKEKPDCLGAGRYCAADPDGIGKLTGREIVMEDLREICIFNKTRKLGQTYEPWFEYMRRFNASCRSNRIQQECSEEAMQQAGVNTKEVRGCVQASFTNQSNILVGDNLLLKKEMRMWRSLGVEFFPALIINNRTYRGDWEGLQVAQTLCAAFKQTPAFCSQLQPIESGIPVVVATETVILIIVVSLALVIAVLLLHRLWTKREVNLEIRQQVTFAMTQYQTLNSEGAQMAERQSRTQNK